MSSETTLVVDSAKAGYSNTPVLKGVSFGVQRGTVVGIVGPNGAGKTTLLRVITGIVPLTGGDVILQGKPVQSWSRRALAQQVAVVPQTTSFTFDFRVREIVAMGRLPHQSVWSRESPQDRKAVDEALRSLDMMELADRSFPQLSGGEQRRVILARALAQEPEIMLLDEPTSHLDLGHQQTIMNHCLRLARERNLAVAVVLHDLNIASLFCDKLVVIHNGITALRGAPQEVISEPQIQRIYGLDVEVIPHPSASVPQVLISPRS